MLLDKMILFGFNILLLNFSLTMPWGPLDCRMFVHPSLRAVQSMLAIREAILNKNKGFCAQNHKVGEGDGFPKIIFYTHSSQQIQFCKMSPSINLFFNMPIMYSHGEARYMCKQFKRFKRWGK